MPQIVIPQLLKGILDIFDKFKTTNKQTMFVLKIQNSGYTVRES